MVNIKSLIFLHEGRLAWLSLAIILAYVLRVTIPGAFLPSILTQYLGYGFLFIALFSLLFSQNIKVRPLSLLVLVSVACSVFLSLDFETALTRSLLWILVFLVAGPTIVSTKATVFRNYLWHQSIYIVYVIVVLSFIWNTAGLPIYGKGAAGITAHTMLLGALAGLSLVSSFHALLIRSYTSFFYWGIFISSFLTSLLSGSRSAVLAAAVGCAIILIARYGSLITKFVITVIFIMSSLVFWASFDIGGSENESYGVTTSDGFLSSYTAELSHKGKSNSRELLWKNRISEFQENPIFGIGIGVELYKKENTQHISSIEPGSSYLATLSMTGLVGGGLLLMFLLSLVTKINHGIAQNTEMDISQALGIGAFWAVHAFAEGWIFAGGSLLCLLFWIWVGRLSHFRDVNFKGAI